MGLTGQFDNTSFKKVTNQVLETCKQYKVPNGIHVVEPDPDELRQRIEEGYRFIAYSIDSVFLIHGSQSPYGVE